MSVAYTPLAFPSLGPLYAAFTNVAEALLRLVVALALIMHGLRMIFGFFPDTCIPLRNVHMLAAQFDREGYQPS